MISDRAMEQLEVPKRVQLIVEPTPFTHVSGYANRFKEYLKYQKKAGADVSIITPDDSAEAPSDFLGYPITTIRGFRFPLYKQIYLSFGLSPVEGMRKGLWRRLRPWNEIKKRRKNKIECLSAVSDVVDDFEPELIHVTSPGFIPYMTTYIAREWKDVPLLISYLHAHPGVRADLRAVDGRFRRVALLGGDSAAALVCRPDGRHVATDEGGVRGAWRSACRGVEQGH